MEQLEENEMAVSKIIEGMTKDEINYVLDRELDELMKHEHLKAKIINETLDRMIEETKETLSPITINREIVSFLILNDKIAQKAFIMTLKKAALPYILKKWVKNGGI